MVICLFIFGFGFPFARLVLCWYVTSLHDYVNKYSYAYSHGHGEI